MWKFLGQGSNLCHSSDNSRSLTHWATREFLTHFFRKKQNPSPDPCPLSTAQFLCSFLLKLILLMLLCPVLYKAMGRLYPHLPSSSIWQNGPLPSSGTTFFPRLLWYFSPALVVLLFILLCRFFLCQISTFGMPQSSLLGLFSNCAFSFADLINSQNFKFTWNWWFLISYLQWDLLPDLLLVYLSAY